MFDSTDLNRLYKYCFTLTDSEDKAYDLLQSALEKCLQKPPQNEKAKQTYIRRIIHNLFVDQYRKDSRQSLESFDENTVTELDATTETLEELTIQQDLLDKLWPLLNPLEREILFLWAVEGYTTAEVADLLETKKGTVVSRIHRLKARLKQQFKGDIGSALS